MGRIEAVRVGAREAVCGPGSVPVTVNERLFSRPLSELVAVRSRASREGVDSNEEVCVLFWSSNEMVAVRLPHAAGEALSAREAVSTTVTVVVAVSVSFGARCWPPVAVLGAVWLTVGVGTAARLIVGVAWSSRVSVRGMRAGRQSTWTSVEWSQLCSYMSRYVQPPAPVARGDPTAAEAPRALRPA